jgi:hypothetical protein
MALVIRLLLFFFDAETLAHDVVKAPRLFGMDVDLYQSRRPLALCPGWLRRGARLRRRSVSQFRPIVQHNLPMVGSHETEDVFLLKA